MKSITQKVTGDFLLSEDTICSGMVNGSITIDEHVIFICNGTVNGNLILKENANVKLSGTVNGNVVNDGASLEISGIVNGKVFERNGKTIITPGAIINK